MNDSGKDDRITGSTGSAAFFLVLFFNTPPRNAIIGLPGNLADNGKGFPNTYSPGDSFVTEIKVV